MSLKSSNNLKFFVVLISMTVKEEAVKKSSRRAPLFIIKGEIEEEPKWNEKEHSAKKVT